MAEMKLKRPTKGMMLAVNATLDKNQPEVDRLVTEHTLDRKEIQTRIEMRGGERYDLEKGRGPRVLKKATAPSDDIVASIDGRTKISSLLKLHSRIEEILAQKDKQEVTKVRDAMKNIDKLRKQLEDAEALIS